MTQVAAVGGQPGTRVARRRARWSMVAIFFLFAVPLGTAVWLFNSGWRPGSTVNHGELIVPTVDVSGFVLHDRQGDAVTGALLTGQWTIVVVAGQTCNPRCRQQLYDTRQVRLAVGKDIDRVQRVLLVAAQTGLPAAALDAHPDLRILQGPVTGDLNQTGTILMVDPLGNLMMRYPDDYQPRGMLKDLQRLLKWSEIG